MQVILNWILLSLTYFLAQIFLYRFFKININKHSVILLIIVISIIIGFYSFSVEVLINLININLMIVCFYIIMPGIINDGPTLTIINLIENKKINKKKKLKKLFLKSKAGKAIEKRVKLNISSNFLKLKKGGLTVNKNAERLIIFFNLIKKIYRLK
jgi:hypothetical protein